jgi:hypothetical protein
MPNIEKILTIDSVQLTKLLAKRAEKHNMKNPSIYFHIDRDTAEFEYARISETIEVD